MKILTLILLVSPAFGQLASTSPTPANQSIYYGGSIMRKRPTIGMLGAGVICVDNPTNNRIDCTYSGGTGGSGTVTTVNTPSVPSWFTAAVANATTTPTITLSMTGSQTPHQVIGTCGSATTFGPCPLVAGDIPSIPDSGITFANRAANIVFAGPSSGSAAVPSWRPLVASDIPALPYDASGLAASLSAAAQTAAEAASDPLGAWLGSNQVGTPTSSCTTVNLGATYKNTTTGDPYECTEIGTTAQWVRIPFTQDAGPLAITGQESTSGPPVVSATGGVTYALPSAGTDAVIFAGGQAQIFTSASPSVTTPTGTTIPPTDCSTGTGLGPTSFLQTITATGTGTTVSCYNPNTISGSTAATGSLGMVMSAPNQRFLLSGPLSLTLTYTSALPGVTYTIYFIQPASGGPYVPTMLPASGAGSIIWPGGTHPVWSTAANARDKVVCTYDALSQRFPCVLSGQWLQ